MRPNPIAALTAGRPVFASLPRLAAGLLIATAVAAGLSSGCADSSARVRADDPQMASYVQLVMPSHVKILEWTKPVSLAGDGSADALEVIVEARDSFDDLTKVVGTFHFELSTRKLADSVGTRVAFWPIEVNTEKSMRMYRDRLSKFYHFPLQLQAPPLPAGRYNLSMWLHLAGGERLFDEYEFDYDGKAAPPPSTF
jgi:hypothetical protein